MFVSAIVAAGGHGARLGGGEPKQLRLVGGRAVLERSVSAFLAHPAIAEVIVALPRDLVDDPPAYLRAHADAAKPLRLVAGGERRQDSVANAFRAAAPASELIVIHDAARPFVSADVITRTIEAAAESGAAVAALPARDTVKRAALMVRQAHHERTRKPLIVSSSKDERSWVVESTLARETIFLAQTPQAFRRDVLAAAFDYATRTHSEGTDEAALAEGAGHTVRLVDGDASNIKITTPEDLVIAEAIAGGRSAEASRSSGQQSDGTPGDPSAPMRDGVSFSRAIGTGRAGTGYDLHRLVAGRPLIIGGVTIPSDRGAVGHSDADVACHAITDAILGAAGLGDIGRLFPDSDPRWKGASSLDLLSRAVAIAREAGYEIGNVDVTVILEAPKIRDHVGAMRDAIAAAIGIAADCVSVKGKTNEGVDAVGRGEAIAAHAIALVRARS
jgi:2-C-methyl-D-erythritol 4-phosphate cytidylyltransferase / 2-C-methyl-D-erythritol 2,4-cyclodiphosphate synthase